eukprot:TRINITY_DN15824_c0_g1_i1.p1 TRINITY_DN15824_c0_g1~~TRINITY_DN15824_c0_g1_i1.p1  ORF type:complete len:287 (+),score=73.47 TRINITY_DN15824_c0_g1_i1:40-900(+)
MLVTRFGRCKLQTRHFSVSASVNTYKFLDVSSEGPVLYIKMNRPELSNAFNEDLIAEMINAFSTVDTASTKAVVLVGNGKQFSAGADLNWMKKMAKYSKEENEKDSHALFDMFEAIRSTPVPTIARVNGAALGGGAGLVAACDIAIGVNRSIFGFTEVKLGLIPAVISPFVISKIGSAHARRFFLTGERFSANQAVQIGLLNASHETEEEMDQEINSILKEIKLSGPKAVQHAKKLIAAVSEMDIQNPETKKFVCSQIAGIRVSEEGQEGLNAFLTKQKPNWTSSE